MGRHRKPDPEDSADQPSDEFAADYSDLGDDLGEVADHPEGGRLEGFGYPGAVSAPAAEQPADDDRYPPGDEYPDFPAREPSPDPLIPPPPPPPLFSAGQRGFDEAGGGHRSNRGRRGRQHRRDRCPGRGRGGGGPG